MASRVSVNLFYACDKSSGSMFKGIYAIKMANDKIDEVYFKLETKIENRNVIDMIVKEFDAITNYNS